VAEHWIALVRTGGDRSFDYGAEAFFELLPPPARSVLELGCGEGRVARRLAALGYAVVGLDSSPTMVGLAREADPDGEYVLGDAVALPFGDASFDLVAAFMSLQDMDDPAAAICESARVLVSGGCFCFAVIHPLWTSGEVDDDANRFVIRGSYLAAVPHIRPVMQVPSIHRPLESYFRGLEEGGLLVQTMHELPTRTRLPGLLPVYLHVRAVRT
jgi:ubiquinone/menaquinone biosynthesis C-methylase UbiE